MASPHITGVILTGGRARRMNGIDKGLTLLAGRPLLAHILPVLTVQVADIVISANRNLDQYRTFGHPVVSDASSDFRGPLAGILSALDATTAPYLLTLPGDCPFPPAGLAARLAAALRAHGGALAVAHDGATLQPLFMLVARGLHASLHDYLHSGGRPARAWLLANGALPVDFSDQPHAFMNINTPDELRRAGQWLAQTTGSAAPC